MDHKQARIHITEGFVATFGRVPTRNEAQAAQGIGYLESRYGTAWTGAGVGSFNWGCVQSSRPPCEPSISFQFKDTHPNPDGTSTEYSICFRKYLNDSDGARDLIRIAFGMMGKEKPALEAAARGDLYGVSAALRKQGYYEGFGKTQADRIENHHKALASAVRAQCLALNEPFPDGKPTMVTQIGKVVGALLPAAAFKPTRNLRRGMYGEDVRAWQMTLNQISGGFGRIVTDGCFGLETRELTMIWQHAHKLVPDGIVGPKTRAAATAALKQAT